MTLPTRRLAYRDRYVWFLVQGLTGGSSVLPPVQFSPGVETELIVSFTQERWNQTFAALMAGADLLYPEESHEVVWNLLKYVEYPMPAIGFGFDSEVNCWGRDAVPVGGSSGLTHSILSTQLYNAISQATTPNLNNTYRWMRRMSAGTWECALLYRRVSNGGIIDVKVSPVSGGTVVAIDNLDQRGSTLENQRATGTFTLNVSELCYIDIEVVATSLGSNYGCNFTLLNMWRV